MPVVEGKADFPVAHSDQNLERTPVRWPISWKGHDRVLEALSQVVGEFPDIVYLIAGDGPHRGDLQRLVASHGLEKHVRLLGAISDEDLERVYAACDVFVMASRQEGLTVEGFGKEFSKLRVQTPDQTPNAENRRVEIRRR